MPRESADEDTPLQAECERLGSGMEAQQQCVYWAALTMSIGVHISPPTAFAVSPDRKCTLGSWDDPAPGGEEGAREGEGGGNTETAWVWGKQGPPVMLGTQAHMHA